MSQTRRREGGIWTLLTANDSATMRSGTERLSIVSNWRQVAGRVSALEPNAERLTVLHSNNPTIIETQPLSLTNLRLVAANWFSGNLLYFAGAIALVGVLLMAATSFVLTQLGRRQ